MPVSRQADPRANQKARTRAELVDAAARLFRQGSRPTVSEAADEARVSRATAYRYFPTQDALLLEVAQLNPAVAPVEEAIRALPTGDPERRLRGLLDAINPIVLDEETSMRVALRVYLDTWLENRGNGSTPAVREGRRMRWLDEVLADVRSDLPPEQWRRLRAALALTLGTEAVVVMKDVCRIEDGEEILDVLQWAAAALLRAASEEAPSQPKAELRKKAGA
jgi:AcrR family transcriptional regulator